jgi:hypothetical protein
MGDIHMLRSIILATVIFISSFNIGQAKPEDVDVYLMRGLFGFLFENLGGVYTINKDLTEKGYNVVFTCWQDPCMDSIVKSIKANPDRKFAIIGHSMGGNGITIIGEKLDDTDIVIPYSAIIDAPMPETLVDNFGVVDNIFQFNDFRQPAKLKAVSKKTILNQYDYRGWKYNHFSIAEAKVVRERIYEQLELLSKAKSVKSYIEKSIPYKKPVVKPKK